MKNHGGESILVPGINWTVCVAFIGFPENTEALGKGGTGFSGLCLRRKISSHEMLLKLQKADSVCDFSGWFRHFNHWEELIAGENWPVKLELIRAKNTTANVSLPWFPRKLDVNVYPSCSEPHNCKVFIEAFLFLLNTQNLSTSVHLAENENSHVALSGITQSIRGLYAILLCLRQWSSKNEKSAEELQARVSVQINSLRK